MISRYMDHSNLSFEACSWLVTMMEVLLTNLYKKLLRGGKKSIILSHGNSHAPTGFPANGSQCKRKTDGSRDYQLNSK